MQKERPLSPHLQVYKPQLTSMLSILHRGTGIFLSLGAPFLVYWLAAIAGGPQAYEKVHTLAQNWFVTLLLLGWVFSLYYHLCNGIRHLFWDVGRGFDIEDLYKSGWMVLGAALGLTVLTVILAVGRMGGA